MIYSCSTEVGAIKVEFSCDTQTNEFYNLCYKTIDNPVVIFVILIGKSKVGKVTPKPNNTYPFVRLPQECTDVIGQSFAVYDTDYKGKRAFLLVMGDESPKVIQQKMKQTVEKRMDSLENKIDQILEQININNKQNESEKIWARRDSNTRSSPCEGDVIAN